MEKEKYTSLSIKRERKASGELIQIGSFRAQRTKRLLLSLPWLVFVGLSVGRTFGRERFERGDWKHNLRTYDRERKKG